MSKDGGRDKEDTALIHNGMVAHICLSMQETWVQSGRLPWSSKWQPTPVLLPGKFHEQRSLVGYSPCEHKRVGHHLATKQQLGEKKKEVGHITDKPQVEGKNGIK